MTKPEGPKGYVAHKFVVSGNGNKCGVCGVAHNGDASTWVPDVPATPAPSQPAGAREPRCEMCGMAVQSTIGLTMRGPMCCQPCFTKYCSMTVKELMELYAREQTAAKDAELKACWNQLCDIGFMFDVVTPENNLRLAEIVKHKKEAAERERDSLREANARLAADLDAALKAAKDEQ